MRKTTEQFIKEARKIHGDIYDYSKVIYESSTKEVIIICPKHGEFSKTPTKHIHRSSGCKQCSLKKRGADSKKTTEQFIEEARIIYGDKYNYSKTEYLSAHDKLIIICPEHGEFLVSGSNHVNLNSGCPECGKEKSARKRNKTTEQFIEEAIKIHGDIYDYSKSLYTKRKNKLTISCKKHGDFDQEAGSHLGGKGCPLCNASGGESEIRKILKNKKLIFEEQKRFSDCRSVYTLPFDFCVKKENGFFLIEFDGRHHFESIEFFGGDDSLLATKERDKIKNEYCAKNNINLYRINHKENIEEKIEEILEIENGKIYIHTMDSE